MYYIVHKFYYAYSLVHPCPKRGNKITNPKTQIGKCES